MFCKAEHAEQAEQMLTLVLLGLFCLTLPYSRSWVELGEVGSLRVRAARLAKRNKGVTKLRFVAPLLRFAGLARLTIQVKYFYNIDNLSIQYYK